MLLKNLDNLEKHSLSRLTTVFVGVSDFAKSLVFLYLTQLVKRMTQIVSKSV